MSQAARGYIITIPVDGRLSAAPLLDPDTVLAPLQAIVAGDIEIVPLLTTVNLTPYLDDVAEPGAVEMLRAGWRPCVAFCNEEGKLEGLPYNERATQIWASALVHGGHVKPMTDGRVAMDDVLCGAIAICIGDPEVLDEL